MLPQEHFTQVLNTGQDAPIRLQYKTIIKVKRINESSTNQVTDLNDYKVLSEYLAPPEGEELCYIGNR